MSAATASWALPLAAFWVLALGTLAAPARRARVAAKAGADWALDLAGLAVQGAVIPLLQAVLAFQVLGAAAPAWRGAVALPGWAAFLLAFVGADYLFYWNHRALHSRWLWPAHRVHHTMTDRDVLGTSRNTLWSSFLICYLWVHGAALFLLAEPGGYLLGVAATSALDLWRHSDLGPAPGGALHRALAPWLILPEDHAWHHAGAGFRANFGANLKLWDRLHGTLYAAEGPPPELLGIPFEAGLGRKLLWPFAP